GGGIDDRRAFAKRTNELLGELGASHTRYYLPTDLDYAPLLSIFESSRARHKIEHDSIGAEFIRLPEGTFVRKVFAGAPSESGGLRRGDRVLTADHRPFDPYASIHDRAG